jgi:Transposase, Mutator family
VTLTKSDVTDLLDAIRAGGDIDVIRKGVELVLQALIDAEATELIGAGRYERSSTSTDCPNRAHTARRAGSTERRRARSGSLPRPTGRAPSDGDALLRTDDSAPEPPLGATPLCAARPGRGYAVGRLA